jgi:hypothetical protein
MTNNTEKEIFDCLEIKITLASASPNCTLKFKSPCFAGARVQTSRELVQCVVDADH